MYIERDVLYGEVLKLCLVNNKVNGTTVVCLSGRAGVIRDIRGALVTLPVGSQGGKGRGV